jgi:hypothetical protein
VSVSVPGEGDIASASFRQDGGAVLRLRTSFRCTFLLSSSANSFTSTGVPFWLPGYELRKAKNRGALLLNLTNISNLGSISLP